MDTWRLGQEDDAVQHLAALHKEKRGLDLWERIFAAEQGSVLRGMLGDDVKLARRLMETDDPLASLRRAVSPSPKS
jgi:hypothetical protein